MESEKVKEIKECLEEFKDDKIGYYTNGINRFMLTKEDILTYINELESENERLKHLREVDNKTMTTLRQANNELNECMDEMQDRIAELEKENAILQGAKERLTFADRIELVDNAVKIKLKQFAERLKEITCEMYLKEQLHHCIDETLKELQK